MTRTFTPPPRSTIVLPDAHEHGPLVTPIDWSAGDRAVAQYFWTSTDRDTDAWTCDEKEIARVISYGMKAQPVPHGTPSGHGVLTVHVERVTIPTAEQLLRHRVQVQSPDGNSTFWVELAANISKKSFRGSAANQSGTDRAQTGIAFYIPDPEQVRRQSDRPWQYQYEPLDRAEAEAGIAELTDLAAHSALVYGSLLERGWAFEQARFALLMALETRLYITTSYRNWFNWLVQRNDAHTQGETREAAIQVESILAQCCPITYRLWIANGRRVI